MGYDLIAAAFAVVLTPFVILGFILFWVVNARDHEELAASWRAYAMKRGLDFHEPEGEWPNRTSPAIAWRDGDADLRICALGREAKVRTRLVVRPGATLLGKVALSIDGSGAGDDVHVREHPPGLARRILSERVRRLLLGLRQRDRVMLTYRRGRITVEWPGGEQNEARLDDARNVGEELARTIDEEFRATATAARAA